MLSDTASNSETQNAEASCVEAQTGALRLAVNTFYNPQLLQ